MTASKLRFEPWGAWVRVADAPALVAIVAIDRDGVRALGLDGGRVWSRPPRPSAPLEVHLAVTSRCGAGCVGCYLDARPDGEEPELQKILDVFDELARAGVFTVAIGGGEPTTRADLGVIAEAARARGLVPVLTTSGLGLGPAKIERLRAFAQVNVSYDGRGADYAAVRGFEGAREAEEAISAIASAGIPVGVNVVLTRATFGALSRTLTRAKELGAREAQLLRYKPAGRAAQRLDYMAARLSLEQAASLGPTLRALSEGVCGDGFHVRIDCALVPFLSGDEAIMANPERLAALGVFGCEGAQALAAVKVDGKVAPCSFAASSTLGVAAFARGAEDDEIRAFRAHSEAPPEPCASCPIRAICKGGCKVVSRFVDAANGPDPECPRVAASHRSSRA